MSDLVAVQKRCGHEITCLVHNHKRSLSAVRENVDGIDVLRTPIIGKFLFTPLSPFFIRDFKRLLKEQKPDLIHIQMPNVSAFAALYVKSCSDIPVIVHWQSDVITADSGFLMTLAYKMYRPLEQRLLRVAKLIISTTDAYSKSSQPLREWQEKVRVVPVGIADKNAATQKEKSTDNNGRLNLLCIGRLTYYKGHKYLLEAVERFPECTLTVVGTGDQQQGLEKWLVRSKAKDRILFTGAVDGERLDQLLQECDALCLPSIERTEAFGVVLLEAMRVEKAVISSDVTGSGMAWVVDDGVTGILVKPNNVIELVNAISTLSKDPELRYSMGRAGRERFLKYMEIEKVAEQIDELYESVL